MQSQSQYLFHNLQTFKSRKIKSFKRNRKIKRISFKSKGQKKFSKYRWLSKIKTEVIGLEEEKRLNPSRPMQLL